MITFFITAPCITGLCTVINPFSAVCPILMHRDVAIVVITDPLKCNADIKSVARRSGGFFLDQRWLITPEDA
jgi:hypothetical protein